MDPQAQYDALWGGILQGGLGDFLIWGVGGPQEVASAGAMLLVLWMVFRTGFVLVRRLLERLNGAVVDDWDGRGSADHVDDFDEVDADGNVVQWRNGKRVN